jgi:Sulfotransferase domain
MLKKIKQILRSIEIEGAYYCSRNKLLAKLFPFKSPAILLLSYPRSGSSWIGDILSKSKSVAYLLEPITQAYLTAREGNYTLVDIDNDPIAYSLYKELSDNTFQGVPPDIRTLPNFRHFCLFKRRTRHLLIKEVNPKAAGLYCQHYQPKILFILRHPAAVALSFARQGWLESPDAQLDTGDPDASVWEKFGHAYGSAIKGALSIIQNRCDCDIIFYEDLVRDPEEQFKGLFQSLDLDMPPDYQELIQNYCYSQKLVENNYQTYRISKDSLYKWCKELSISDITSLRKGFEISGLEFYSNNVDWCPNEELNN